MGIIVDKPPKQKKEVNMSAVATAENPAPTGAVPSELIVEREVVKGEAPVPYPFVQQKLKKKNEKDPDRYALVPEKPKFSVAEELNKMVSHLGLELVASLAYGRWRQMSAGWTESATKDGVFNEGEFKKYASEFSARGETIKALLEEKEELTAEIVTLSKDMKMSPADKVVRITEIGNRLNEINETIEFKKREKPEETEAEEKAAAA